MPAAAAKRKGCVRGFVPVHGDGLGTCHAVEAGGARGLGQDKALGWVSSRSGWVQLGN